MLYNRNRKKLLKIIKPHTLTIITFFTYLWQSTLFYEDQKQIIFLITALIILLLISSIRFIFRRVHDWKDIEVILPLIMVVNFLAKTYHDLSSPWLYLHYLIVSLVSSVYNFTFALGVVALIDLSLYLRIALSNTYSIDITKPELLGMALSLPALGILINMLQAIEKHKRAKVASELAFLQYAMDDLDSRHPKAEELRIQKGVDTVYEVNKMIKNILSLLRSSFRTHSCVFIQISASSQKAIIRGYDTASNDFKSGHCVLINSNIYHFAISKQSAFQKQSDSSLSAQLDLYENNKDCIKSVLVVPVVESASVVALIVIDSTEKRVYTKEEIELSNSYSSFIIQQLQVYRMLKESEEKAIQFQMLSHISRELMQSLKLNTILERLLDYCYMSAPYDACLLVLKNKNFIELMIQRGFDNPTKRIKIEQCKNWVGWILLNREEPLLLNDVNTHKMPLWDNTEKIKQWKAVYAVPLIRKSVVVGALVFASEKNDIFKSHIRTMLAIIANNASIIIENSILYEKTEFQAITDGLTEIPNHRFFQETLSNYIEKAKELNEKISLVIADIDFFKKINDTYGHQFGDKVLKKVASILKSSIRDDDFVARYGGEEFAIILKDCDENNAYKVAEKIRKKIQKSDWANLRQKFYVTLSMGIASFPTLANNKNDLIKAADSALYRAKESGRNIVIIAEMRK